MNSQRRLQLGAAAVVASGALALTGLGHPRVAAASCKPGSHCFGFGDIQQCEVLSQAIRDQLCQPYVPAGCTLRSTACVVDVYPYCGGSHTPGLVCGWY
jgi:hypothetical protein